jgi:hypothetical protein
MSVKGTLAPYINLLTSILSPICRVGSIEPDGILNGSIINDRTIKARSTAINMDSIHSLEVDFLLVLLSINSSWHNLQIQSLRLYLITVIVKMITAIKKG